MSVRLHMKSMFPFLLLPPYVHNPDSVLVPFPSLPAPGKGLPLLSISDLVHVTQFSMSSGAYNLAIDATATVVNPVPLAITITAPLPFVVWIPHHHTPITPYSARLCDMRTFHPQLPEHHALPSWWRSPGPPPLWCR